MLCAWCCRADFRRCFIYYCVTESTNGRQISLPTLTVILVRVNQSPHALLVLNAMQARKLHLPLS